MPAENHAPVTAEGGVGQAPVEPERLTLFSSLRFRPFRLFFWGQLISQVGTWMRQIAMALLVLHLTDSGLAVGIVSGCQFLPMLLLGAWAGLVADRADKRRLLMIVQSVLMLQSYVLATLAFTDDPPVVMLYAIALAGGVASAFDNPTRRSFVTEMVPETYVHNAVSLNSALMTGARIFGPALAGLLISTVGFGWCFLIDGLSYIAVLSGLWRMRPEELRPAVPAVRGKGQVREGLRYVARVPTLAYSLVMMAIIGTFALNLSVTLPLFVTRTLDGSETEFTLVYSVLSVGSVIGSLLAARRTSIELPHVVLGAAAMGCGMCLLAGMPTLYLVFPAALILGVTWSSFVTTSTAILQLRAEPSMRGRVIALQSMVFMGSTPIGGPMIGWASQQFGPRVGIAIGGASCLVAALFGVTAGRRTATARAAAPA